MRHEFIMRLLEDRKGNGRIKLLDVSSGQENLLRKIIIVWFDHCSLRDANGLLRGYIVANPRYGSYFLRTFPCFALSPS
jgi:hypothetical protein